MSYIMVDIEADGPIPGDFSMIELGAVVVSQKSDMRDRAFYARLRPISDRFIAEALAVSGHSREECMAFDDPTDVMLRFDDWLKNNSRGRPIFISDNNGFDWMFVCWYFHHFLNRNPFGHSSQNLGSLYKGLVKDGSQNFKHLRRTKHTHHPVDDALGNAEAMIAMKTTLGLRIGLD
ncbi:MAG: exonuclease [Spirochaetae bacterium HGW-Spirochaetae-10]|nr:MAG: exonuclease [Spirochaetae bacterium HGW-Spirochaetae-10]